MSKIQSAGGATIPPNMVSSPAPGSMVLVTKLSRLVYRRATEDVLGMSLKEYASLCKLREQQSMPQQAFCESVHLDPNNCVLLLNALESAGLLERRRDPADRRRHLVVLTTRGRETLKRADHALESVEEEVLGALSPDERATLHQLLLKSVRGAVSQLAEPVASSS